MKHFLYAPYIMHIIEKVSGLKFPMDAPHTVLKISNKMSLQAKNALKKGASGASGSRSRTHSRSSSPPASCSHRASSEEAPSSTSSKRPPNKFKFFMQYMFGACCASAQRGQDMLERQYRLEQHFGIQSQPPPPLVPLHDPFELYEEACAEFYGESSSNPRGKGKQPIDEEHPEDEEYQEEGDDDDDDDDGDDDGDDVDYEE